MKTIKIDRKTLRSKINHKLKVTKLYQPDNLVTRKFINELLNVSLSPMILSRIIKSNEMEELPVDKQEIIDNLYISEAIHGILSLNDGQEISSIIEKIEKRFGLGGAIFG